MFISIIPQKLKVSSFYNKKAIKFDLKNKSSELNMRLYTDVLSNFSSNGYRAAVREFASKYYSCGIYQANKTLSYDLLSTKSDTDFVYSV